VPLPSNKGSLQKTITKFQGLARLLDLSPFASFKIDETTRMVLDLPTPSIDARLKGMDYRLSYPNLSL